MLEILLFIKIFMFIFCLLNIIKNVYNIIKIMYLQSGGLTNGKYNTLFFGLSLSYVITILIIGF